MTGFQGLMDYPSKGNQVTASNPLNEQNWRVTWSEGRKTFTKAFSKREAEEFYDDLHLRSETSCISMWQA